jgi:hypothetical protein
VPATLLRKMQGTAEMLAHSDALVTRLTLHGLTSDLWVTLVAVVTEVTQVQPVTLVTVVIHTLW